MIFGNWTAIDKRLVDSLPKPGGREYTELEAMFSVSVDHDNKTPVSVSRYSRQWGWNRKTVKRHFDKWGIEITYPESTSKKQNQMGQISIQIRDRSGTDQGQIRFIDNSDLMKERIRSGTDKGQKRDRSGATTIYPNPNPDTKPKKVIYPESFLKLFTDYPNTNGSKSQTFKNWKATKKILEPEQIYTACMNSAARQEQNSTGDVYYFQLSNLLSARKYRGDLSDLINWIPNPGIKKGDGIQKRSQTISEKNEQFFDGIKRQLDERENKRESDSGSIEHIV